MKPDEFAARFSPTQTDYDAVTAFAKSQGFTIESTTPNRTMLDVSAPSDIVEKAFGFHYLEYVAPDGSSYRAPDQEPSIPRDMLGKVDGLAGLSNPKIVHNHAVKFDGRSAPHYSTTPQGTGPGNGYFPTDIQTAYNLTGLNLTGAGQSIALVEYDGYTASDIQTYITAAALPTSSAVVSTITTDGANYTGSKLNSNGGQGEVTLDIELALALAPKITNCYVYEGLFSTDQQYLDVFNKIATDDKAQQISCSWGAAEVYNDATTYNGENKDLMQYATQGQTFYVAAGDSGCYDGAIESPSRTKSNWTLQVDDPSSQPYATAVGGTSLLVAAAASNEAYGSESVWNDDYGAGGGGISTVWAIPSYQSGISISTSAKASKTMKNVPDVTLNAAVEQYYAIYVAGAWGGYGGTSCASPLWASFNALVNQNRAANGKTTLGFANTPLYSLYSSSTYARDFNDIADGSNNNLANSYKYYTNSTKYPGVSVIPYTAVTGYDDVSGLGSFKGIDLLADLSGPTDVSALYTVTGSGLTYNRSTKVYSGTVTVKYNGTIPSATPTRFVFSGLPAGVAVTNKTGLQGGYPYITILSTPIPQGAVFTSPVTYTDPSGVKISYTPQITQGS